MDSEADVGLARCEKPVPLVLVSDPGQDLDDEMTFIMLRFLVEHNIVEVKGIITTLAPAFDRARLTRGTLDVLGLFGVPIGVGSDGGDIIGKHKAETFVEWARPYMVPRYSAASDAFKPGRMLLHTLYTAAEPNSLTLVIIAALKDPALFLRDEEQLFKEKTREVVIMGGVEPWDKDDAKKGAGGATTLVPDTANNNTFDFDAAKYFHQRCQELGIPLVIVTRWAAYAAKVPVSCYNELAAHGSWIGCRLRNAQRASIEGLWSRAASPPGSDARHGLPDRCDRAWFLKTFCAGVDAPERGAQDTIWDLIAGFMQYDTVATLAAVPMLRERFFRPCVVQGLHGVRHLVIGRTEEDHNIRTTEGLSKFLNMGFKSGLAYNHQRKTQFILLLQPRWSNEAENFAGFVVLRALFELGIFDCAGIVLQPVPNEKASEQQNVAEFQRETQKNLGQLGLSHVPILVADPKGTTGAQHLEYLYGRITPAGISLVVTGSVDVAADFAERHPRAFVHKTQAVILVGGAKCVPEKDEQGRETGKTMLEPDPGAQNNELDLAAAKRFFRTAQKLLVPLIIISRHFAQAVQLPRAFFDLIREAHYGGAVGQRLHDLQRAGVANLWTAVRAHPSNSSARRNLPERCNREWFIKSFSGHLEPASDSTDDVWKNVRSFNVYNLLAILLACPPIYNRFVRAKAITVRSVNHCIIGADAADPGCLDPLDFKKCILQCIIMGSRLNSSVFELKEPPPVPLDSSQSSSTTWRYDSRKEAFLWLLPVENRDAYMSGSTAGLLAAPGASQDLWERKL